jgi:hypothetical protein
MSTMAVAPGALVAVPLPNGLLGIVWILAVETVGRKPYFKLIVLDGFFDAVPAPAQLARLGAAKSAGGTLPGEEDIWKACFFGEPPRDFAVVGARKLPPKTSAWFAAEGTMVFQDGENCRAQLFLQWRLVHDRPALEVEWARAEEARERRADERRRTVTLPKMLRERPFASWSEHWPPRVVREARRIFRDATRDLIALEKKGTKRQRTTVLKRIVTELNALDDTEGCMETGEREEVVARIESLASLVGLSNEDEKLTGHRDW